MGRSAFLYIGLISFTSSTAVFAQSVENDLPSSQNKVETFLASTTEIRAQVKAALQNNATANQSDEEKDPLQAWNRKVFSFNEAIDRSFARPLAVQYTEKVPKDVRTTYTQFRSNLSEPWNAVNQLVQGRPLRAAKSLGRFSINTLTTLGLADPARRLGLEAESERFGLTLGYYGVPSGPFLVLPVYGPSSVRDGFGTVVDSQARPQKYILEDHDNLYWGDQVWRGIDARSQFLEVEGVLTGDKYSQIRDIYLQRTNFAIAEKKGLGSENLFMDLDDTDIENDDEIQSTDDGI